MHRQSPTKRTAGGGSQKNGPSSGKYLRLSILYFILFLAPACSVSARSSDGAFISALPGRCGVFPNPTATSTFPKFRRGQAIGGRSFHLNLSAGGDDGDETDPEKSDPVSPVKKGLDEFVTLSYRGLLFGTPFFSNPKFRDTAKPFLRPEVLVPAALALATLSVASSVYERRYYDLADAVERRIAARSALRGLRVAGLDRTVSDGETARVVAEYGEALRAEVALRNVAPGLFRMGEFEDPVGSAEDVAAARQYLGMEFDGDGRLVRTGGEDE